MSAPPAKLNLLIAASDFKNMFNSKTTKFLCIQQTFQTSDNSQGWKTRKKKKKKNTHYSKQARRQSTPCNTLKIFVVGHEIKKEFIITCSVLMFKNPDNQFNLRL